MYYPPDAEFDCEGCGDALVFREGDFCLDCREHDGLDFLDFLDDMHTFADPNGHSALRAANASNPRNLPCPTCGEQNRLTPIDVSCGYQCDSCADALERGF